jgi:pimeloyl-ACP methyl ester carboxylesterase
MRPALPIPSGFGLRRADAPATADRPVVALLHSSGASSRQWDALVECLRPAFDVHAVDLHGHGRQAPWGGDTPLSVQAEATLVVPLLERAGGAHLIGHSYGAAVATHLAVAKPSLVRSLAVFEPVLFGLLADQDPLGAAACEAFDLAAQLHALVDSGQAAAAAEQFVDYWSGPSAWKRISSPAQQSVVSRMPIVVQHFDALFGEALAPDQLARLTMPVLCLAGDRSTAAALRIADLLHTLLPDASHELLAGIGHLGPMTHPALVNQRLLRFLDTLVPSLHFPRPAVRPGISTTLPMEQSA